MHIARILIRNILGIRHLDIQPGQFTEIAGPNGSGKTSVLGAIKGALQKGHDATLIHKGAEEGEVVLLLDEGTEIRHRVRAQNAIKDVKQNGKKVTRGQELIDSLSDLISMNPIDFLRAPKKDRVRVLLETMPLRVDPARLTTLSGVKVADDVVDLHGLEVIDAVRQQVYDERTGTNRAIKEKEATVNQLSSALPSEEDLALAEDNNLSSLLAARDEADDAKDAELARIDTKLGGMRREMEDRVRDLQAKIVELQQQVAAERQGFAEWEGRANKQRELTVQDHAAARADLTQQIAGIESAQKAVGRAQQARQTIADLNKEIGELGEDSAKQTRALEAIEAYKLELLNSLPITGLEVRDGEIYRDGVVFDRLNTAQQVDIAFEIAKLRAGDLGVICIDGIELLDTAAYEAFKDRALESGLQLFVTKVADDEFAITSEDME